MSDQTIENPEAVELPRSGDSAFSALMDVLAPEPGSETPAEGAAPADPAAAPAGGAAEPGGQPDVPVAGEPGSLGTAPAGGDAVPGGAPADGVAGTAGAGAGADAVSGGTAVPATWTATAASLAPKLGELSTGFETKVTEAYQAQALSDAREEFGKYFEALEQHPRLLAGQRVPKLDGSEGEELLRDAADAREWQEALKHVLVEEVQSRVAVLQKDQASFLDTVHASIDIFKNNPDLMPYTKDFDTELATRFAEFATPYELRVEGKLQGYSIPVQPLIDQIRERLVTERAAAPTPAQAPAATKGAAGAPPAPAAPAPAADPPQAGIPNKAGNSGEQGEDFGPLWGTLGLPNITL